MRFNISFYENLFLPWILYGVTCTDLVSVYVSIPQRDIGILEPYLKIPDSTKSSFQSLKGISAFWNLPLPDCSSQQPCFNPSKGYRHFGTSFGANIAKLPEVSIPQRDIGILELLMLV